MIMVAHHPRLKIVKRQPPPLPTVPGFGGVATVTVDPSLDSSGTALATDPNATAAISQAAPSLAPSVVSPVPTDIPSTTAAAPPAETSSSSDSSLEAASAASKPLPLPTVIGSCIGAFVGAVALIVFGLWIYRRYLKSLAAKAAAQPRTPNGASSNSRNIRGDKQRRQSRLEPWNKLEDGDDKWEDMYQTKEVGNVAPMEKLTMFKKKSPSMRTAYTQKSDGDEPPQLQFSHPFAQSFAANLDSDIVEKDVAIPRPYLGRSETVATSWDGETVKDQSYISFHSDPVRGGAMSPSLTMAIPTPPATASEPHRWESAEVYHYEGQTAEVVDPDREKRESMNNPFFNNQDYAPQSRRSRSNSSSQPRQHSKKGKEREIYPDPFDDEIDQFPTQPKFMHHVGTPSLGSTASNERAIQSLIAALDVPEEEVQKRLRVESVDPSINSLLSAYGNMADEDDVTKDFPLPPQRGISGRS